MATLPRAVLKWLQSIPITPHCARRDFSSGYFVALIFVKYFPGALRIEAFDEGQSLDRKLVNWGLLRKFFKDHCIFVEEDLIEGTIHCKPGAAEALVQRIYTMLTEKRLPPIAPDFSDFSYQCSLPAHARATVASAIKANLTSSELVAHPDLEQQQRAVQEIAMMHATLRTDQREFSPERFGISPRGPTGHATPVGGATLR